MATRKLTLFDIEREILVEVVLSEADAARAETDMLFATELLRSKINQEPQASTSADFEHEYPELYNEETSGSFIDQERVDSEDPGDLNSETPDSEESNDSARGSDSGCSLKSNKTSIATLLGKRLKQKEEREENKKKRHIERMEMEEKFLSFRKIS